MSSSAIEKSGPDLSADELTLWLRERIAAHLVMSPDAIDVDESLTTYGLDSIYALTVVAEIEDHLGLSLEPTVMWDRPTVSGLLEAIAAERPLAA
ncbi:acyl carrier protein [Streptomyces violaceorubidus]|uniref:Acyl carrier protein n=1 Tax=Streptomyces violaceorubidus TaxID=284042 RepID=A0ABV1T6E0_9ACTN